MPTLDAVMMFKTLVSQTLYGLSDEQAEFQIMDRRTFGRFLGLLDGAGKGSHQKRLTNTDATN